MRTLAFIIVGLLCWGVLWAVCRVRRTAAPASLAARIFLPLWLLVAVVNLWIGVAHAGYSVAEEMPVLLVLFGVPAALAAAAWLLERSTR